MGTHSWTVLQVFLASIAVLITSFGIFAWWRLTYWRRRGIFYLPPSFPFGNAKDAFLGRTPFAQVVQEIYRKISDKPFAGIYMALQPSLYVMEPELIKDVLIRQATTNFQHHIADVDPKKDPITAENIFMIRGPRWKELRSGLSPAFSSGKLKTMYPLLLAKGKLLSDKLNEIASSKDPTVDMKLMTARFTTDVIATCAFGIETNCLNDPTNEFLNMGLKIFEKTFLHTIHTMIIFEFSSLAKITGATFIVKEVAEFFRSLVWNVVKERESKGIRRGDYMDTLIELKNKGRILVPGEEDNKQVLKSLEGDSFVAQALVFYMAGYETSSTAMNFTLIELASQPDCQERLHKEIKSTLDANGGEISYETIHGMHYLDMVINETLRKYPTLPVLDRYCNEEYRNPKYNLFIPKGMHVLVPIYGIHNDPKYYPNPEKFDPERFTEEAKASRPSYAFMPFGAGPRICIGMRFALMQIKVGLVSMLSQYQFSLPDDLKGMKTLPLDTKSFLTTAEDGMRLIVSKRQ